MTPCEREPARSWPRVGERGKLAGSRRTPTRENPIATVLGFWYAAAAVLLVLSIGTVAAVHHGHGLEAFFLLISGGCFAAAQLVQRALDSPNV